MLILLPPSESKQAADSGDPVNFAELSFPELTEARERVAEVLAEVSARENALEVLKVGESLAAEVEWNTRIFDEPVQPAWQVYNGVLFEALDYAGLKRHARRAADSRLLVVSALWGAISLGDYIPAYRLSMGIKLADCGNLATFWRGELTDPLDAWAGQQLVLDCRSSAYSRAWVPAPEQTYTVRVEKDLGSGKRQTISHMAKHYRGLLTRYILDRQLSELNDIDLLVAELSSKFCVEKSNASEKKAGSITLVVPG